MLPGLFSASGHVFYLSFISWGIILCLLLPSGRQDNMDGTALLLNYGAKGNIHECLLSVIFTILTTKMIQMLQMFVTSRELVK